MVQKTLYDILYSLDGAIRSVINEIKSDELVLY